MNSKLYDALKYTAQIFLPALIAFYGVTAVTLNIPYTEQVLTVAAAFTTLLGALLAKSSAAYYKEQANE